MSIVKLMTMGDTAKLIDSIAERGPTLQTDIHTAAVNSFNHAFVHGDNTLCTRLLDVLPNGQRVKALAFWFSHFSNGALTLSVDAETKAWKVNKDRFARRADLVPDVQGATDRAMETTFADLTAEKDPQTLTVEKWLKSLKRTATNAENFDGTDIPKVAPALRALASNIVKVVEEQLKAA